MINLSSLYGRWNGYVIFFKSKTFSLFFCFFIFCLFLFICCCCCFFFLKVLKRSKVVYLCQNRRLSFFSTRFFHSTIYKHKTAGCKGLGKGFESLNCPKLFLSGSRISWGFKSTFNMAARLRRDKGFDLRQNTTLLPFKPHRNILFNILLKLFISISVSVETTTLPPTTTQPPKTTQPPTGKL